MLCLVVKVSTFDDIVFIRKICAFPLGFQIFSGLLSYIPLPMHWSVFRKSLQQTGEKQYSTVNRITKILCKIDKQEIKSHYRSSILRSVDKIRYDTIRYSSLTWTRKLSIQLNLAHVARNQNKQSP